MPLYTYLFLLIALSLLVLLFRFFILRRKNISVELYIEALRNENNGHFETAVITYETALTEVNKIRFHGTLKNKIIQKIKLLHTVVEYNNNLHFIR